MKLDNNALDNLIEACKRIETLNKVSQKKDPIVALFARKDLPSLKRLYGGSVEFGSTIETPFGTFTIYEDVKCPRVFKR